MPRTRMSIIFKAMIFNNFDFFNRYFCCTFFFT